MSVVDGARRVLERALEFACMFFMSSLVIIIVWAVLARKFGASLTWYDEVVPIMLAWLSYFGASLAALKRGHLGFPGLVQVAPPNLRLVLLVFVEVLVIAFFVILAWSGWQIIVIIAGDTLTSLPWVHMSVTQSIIPIGAVLFIIAELLALPDEWRAAREGRRLAHGDG